MPGVCPGDVLNFELIGALVKKNFCADHGKPVMLSVSLDSSSDAEENFVAMSKRLVK